MDFVDFSILVKVNLLNNDVDPCRVCRLWKFSKNILQTMFENKSEKCIELTSMLPFMSYTTGEKRVPNSAKSIKQKTTIRLNYEKNS